MITISVEERNSMQCRAWICWKNKKKKLQYPKLYAISYPIYNLLFDRVRWFCCWRRELQSSWRNRWNRVERMKVYADMSSWRGQAGFKIDMDSKELWD